MFQRRTVFLGIHAECHMNYIKWWISQEFRIPETKFDNFRVSNFGPISLTFPLYSEFLSRITTVSLLRPRIFSKYKIFMKFHKKYVYFTYKYDTNYVFWWKIAIFRTLFGTWFGVAHRSWFRINLTFKTYPAQFSNFLSIFWIFYN